MKNSGIEWIGEIPDSWGLVRFKDICLNKKEVAGSNSADYERLALTLNGVIKRPKDDSEGLQPKEFDGYQIIHENDFIFKMIDLQNISTSRVGLSPYMGLVSPAYIRFVPRKENQYNKFAYYFLMSMYYNCVYNSLGGNGVRSALNATDMGQFKIPYPSLEAQKKIVSFLEQKFVTVDELISNQEKQIEKLKEYKQSVITEAVTKGLDKSAPFKDSGILHIGQIPLHWRVKKHKYVFKKEKILCEKYAGEDILSLTMNGVIVRDLDNPMGKMPTTFDGYQYVKEGNLLLCLFDIDVTPRCVGVIKNNGLTSPAYSQYRIISGDNVNYFYYLSLALDFKKDLLYLSKNLRSSLSDENFGLIETIIPPSQEQQQIVDYLDEKCGQIDRLIAIKQEKIEKLQEYKKSLIYEYVTGKKEVV